MNTPTSTHQSEQTNITPENMTQQPNEETKKMQQPPQFDTHLWSALARNLTPYVPGEQPKHKNLVKLNTNENPFSPSPKVAQAILATLSNGDTLKLYPDPNSQQLVETIASYHGLENNQVFVGNGSDEVLAHIFAAFFTKDRPLLYPDISYSFYPVYSQLYGINAVKIPLRDDFSIHPDDYRQPCDGIIFANPNAPTGLLVDLPTIERFLVEHPSSTVVVDEAYIDFGGESAVSLINNHENLLVCQTTSKSRALAGMRVGMAMGNANLIEALNRVKNSFNSYPIDKLAQAAAVASFQDDAYFQEKNQTIMALRSNLVAELTTLGFETLDSAANFVFSTHPEHEAADIAAKLRESGIIVRHFQQDRIKNHLRITIGTAEQNQALLQKLKAVICE